MAGYSKIAWRPLTEQLKKGNFGWYEYWYDTSYHTSIRTSPFKALYGRDLPPLIHHQINSTSVFEVDYLLAERDAMLDVFVEVVLHLLQHFPRWNFIFFLFLFSIS